MIADERPFRRFTLPWPPSVNHYWSRTKRGNVYVSARGKAYQQEVALIVKRRIRSGTPYDTPVAVSILAFPPDRRKRDIDNLLKASLDAMEGAGVFKNDNLIADLRVVRKEKDAAGGRLEVTVEVL